MKKRTICLLIALLFIATLLPTHVFAADSGSCGTNAKWKIEGDTLTIYGTGAIKDYTAKNLPPWQKSAGSIDYIVIEEGITRIGEYAFAGMYYVASVTFPEGVKTIGSYSFANCEWLDEIHLPLSLETIEDDAFYECTRLSNTYYAGDRYAFSEIYIGGGNRWITTGDIYYTCNHEYPEDIVEISAPTCHLPAEYRCNRCGQNFYMGEVPPHEEEVYPGKDPTCTEPGYTSSARCLTCGHGSRYSEEIPPTGHSFGQWETVNGLKVRTCTVCGSLESSGTCGKTAEWSINDGTLTISGTGSMTNYSDTKLPPWFKEEFLPHIKNIIIEKGITHIGDYAFAGCLFAEYIEIPSTVKTIGELPFTYTVSLKEIFVDYSSKYFEHCNQGALYTKGCTELIWIPSAHEGVFDIWMQVTSISYEALDEARNITAFDVSSSNPVFYPYDPELCSGDGKTLLFFARGSDDLTTTAHVEEVAAFAGANCVKAEMIRLPYEYKLIDEYAFAYCINVKEVILSKDIKKIAENAFLGCDNIRQIRFDGTYEQYQQFLKKVAKEGNEAILNCEYVSFDNCPTHCSNRVYSVVSEATCTEGCYKSEDCADCKSRTIFQDSAPLGHIETIIPEKSPTCTEPGYTQGKQCERCNEIFEGMEEIPATGHKEETVPAVDATCASTGLTEGVKCSACGEILTAQETIPTTAHTYEWTIIREATLTEAGERKGVCSVCSDEVTENYYLYKLGDVNNDGDVDTDDATQILRFVCGKPSVLAEMTPRQALAAGDVDGSGSVDTDDATQILRFVCGKPSLLDQ